MIELQEELSGIPPQVEQNVCCECGKLVIADNCWHVFKESSNELVLKPICDECDLTYGINIKTKEKIDGF